MGNGSKSDSAGKEGAAKKSVAAILTILALSLATWYFFQVQSMPLTPLETSFVVGLWVVLVLIVRGIWARFHKKSKAG